jgi:outer membrane protein assembly factor BamA
VKDDQNGFNLVQQSHVLRLDAPDLWSGRLRMDTRASYQRTINFGYFGIGNAVRVDLTPAPGQASIGKRYEYLQEEGRLRSIARFHTRTPLDLVIGAILRYEAPGAYADSRLAADLAARNPDGSPVIVGGQSSLLAGLAAGIMIDRRDSEFVTRQGFFYQVGAGATVGSAEQVAYGNASAVLAHYAPLGESLVFASRFVASFQFGRVPFYDLAQGGTFEPQYLLGSETGVRGVPIGRYAGPIKMIANTEIRATPFPRFAVWGQRLRIGTTTFFDAGRVWSQYSLTSAADGNSLWLKYGIGGGVFLQWGEAAIFRVEVAYSPDAVSENAGLPLGIYVSDGLQF